MPSPLTILGHALAPLFPMFFFLVVVVLLLKLLSTRTFKGHNGESIVKTAIWLHLDPDSRVVLAA
jgi:hypothetical protein